MEKIPLQILSDYGIITKGGSLTQLNQSVTFWMPTLPLGGRGAILHETTGAIEMPPANYQKIGRRWLWIALTPRERELAGLLLTGIAQKNVAAKMGGSYSAVKLHSANLCRKLNFQSRAELFSLFALPLPEEIEEDS